ncbi:hypothetical protein ASF62_11055 [Leifsonia sp. Leaf325]|nr:hypothetical protein ASF62_11055 [Leifsonia sp. Leaf325]
MAIAYVFAVFLGFAGAHNWYLNRWAVAAGQVALTLGVIVCFIAGYGTASLNFLLWVGILGLIIMFIWWVVDLCTLHIRVKLINERERAA